MYRRFVADNVPWRAPVARIENAIQLFDMKERFEYATGYW